MPLEEVVIVGAARTPIGRYGGQFRDIHPAELGAVATRAALKRATVDPSRIDEALFGHARQAGSGPNPARQVVRRSGLPDSVPAHTINKACASGMQAIASGAQSIVLGESEIVVAGGIESMSRMPYLIDSEDARWGHRMGNFTLDRNGMPARSPTSRRCLRSTGASSSHHDTVGWPVTRPDHARES